MAPRKQVQITPPPAQDSADTAAPKSDTKKEDAEVEQEVYVSETGIVYLLRQYSGFTLGLLSIFLSWYTHVEDSPYMMIRLWLCLGLGLIAVFFHEIRPYKRMGYGDVAWDQLFESKFWKSITGRTKETADFVSGGIRNKRE